MPTSVPQAAQASFRAAGIYFWGEYIIMDVRLQEAAMPLTGPIPEGQSFFCPRCGALYAVTYSRQWKSIDIGDDDNGAECVVCGQTMATWSSTKVPTFKLVHRPDDAA